MVIKHCRLIRAPWLFAHPHQPPHLAAFIKDSTSSQSQPPPLQASPGSRIPPSALFIIVIVAVLFFIAGLLHLLFRFLSKKQPLSPSPRLDRPQPAEFPAPDSLHRQLQQLFHLHDSGLDQVFIDTLPVFLYEEIVGSKEPFDCAVCLCEFAQEDKLRLLPVCGHAFHVNCIDTWLLANSTCPLCRGALFPSGLPADNPVLGFEDSDEEDESYRNAIVEAEAGDVFVEKKRVFSVRLGKFKNLCSGNADNDTSGAAAVSCMRMEEGETSSNNLDPRRCFSMGYYQYVVADSNLQVALISRRIGEDDDVKGAKGMGISERSSSTEVMEGKKLGIASRGESFSVSKIWQLSNKKGKFPVSTGNISPLENLSWIASVADA